MSDFFESVSGSSIHKFLRTEQFLYEGDYTAALDQLSLIDTEHLNAVEYNYLSFYQIYANYLQDGVLSTGDKNTLRYLGTLCPGTEGAVVYQAAALYNSLYWEILYQEECSEGYGEKMTSSNSQGEVNRNKELSDIQVFPNPAKEQLHIKTGQKDERLSIIIKDLSGRTALEKTIKVAGFITTLEIDLINGAYLIYITNSQNEKTIKKLLISK